MTTAFSSETPAPALTRLLSEDRATLSFRRLWGRIPPALRVEIARATLDPDTHAIDVHPAHRADLLTAMAGAGGFRAGTLESMEPAEAARLVVRVPGRDVPGIDDLLRTFLLGTRARMLAHYLDRLGIPHTDGHLPDDHDAAPTPDAARGAAADLLAEFPPTEVVIYLVTLELMGSPLAPGITDWLPKVLSENGEPEHPDGAPGPTPAEEPDDPGAREPELVRELRETASDEQGVPHGPFSPLDRTLIRAAVDTAQGVRGAPDPAELEDMVEELLTLNSDRHQSFFHRGFVDALSGHPYRDELSAAENEGRRAWYLAGHVSGLARRNLHGSIVELHDQRPEVRILAAKARPWASLALPVLFRSFCATGREPEAARMLPPAFVARHPVLLPELLDVGSRLLRADDPERARPVFDRLGEVVQVLESLGEPVTEGFFLEVRRRRAHCYRQLDEPERARELLDRLLDEERDRDIRAMVLADLGLLDAGCRGLADVRLWRTESERVEIRTALGRGEERFRAAVETGGRFASHGAWPLAVIHMTREEWEPARPLLSRALSSFLERPERYEGRRLLARVKVAQGIAEALVMDYARLPRARDLLIDGLGEGARVPNPLLAPMLEALDAHEEELAGEVLTAVLDRQGPAVLRLLHDTAAARTTPAVARHLEARADDAEVRPVERAAALRQALPILLAATPPRVDRARSALDRLEGWARDGVARPEFLALLEEPDTVAPAWDREAAAWARIGILEAEERYEDAVAALRARLGEVLSTHTWTTEPEAEAIVSRARSYGLGPEWVQDIEARFEAWTEEYGEPEEPSLPPTHPNQPYRILVVGGDERQHELRERVARLLEEGGAVAGPHPDAAPSAADSRTADSPAPVPAGAIHIEHLPTGWSGHWSRTLDDAVRASEQADAVVLLTYMRTEFGRSLRAALECPWVSCPGVGTLQVARMVRKAAGFAARQRGAG